MRRLFLPIVCVALIVVFLWEYQTIIVPLYSYSGFTYYSPGFGPLGWAVVLCIIPLLIIPVELFKPSVFLVWWLYVTTFVPSILMPVITRTLPESDAIPLQLSALGSMLLLCAVPYAKTLVLPRAVMPRSSFWWIVMIGWAGCIVFSLASINGPRLLANFALLLNAGGTGGVDYYAVRADYMLQVGQTGRLFGYIGRELVTAIDPFLISYGLLSKQWWMLTIGIVGQLVYFGQTGMKEVPLSIIAIFMVWVLSRKYRKKFGIAFLLAVTCLLIVFTSADLMTHSANFSTLFTRRDLAGPGLLTGFYFEHYSKVAHPGHAFTGNGSSQLIGPPQEIGFYYFGSANVDANANFWAEGFAEYGIPGIFAFALLVALALWLFDSIAAQRSLELAVLLTVVQADALTNSSPLTVLVTHGGILAGILLYCAPDHDKPLWPKARMKQRWPHLGGEGALSR